MTKRLAQGFGLLWAAALLTAWLTQREMAQYFMLLYIFLAGVAVYLVGGALWLTLRALRRKQAGQNASLEAAGVALLLAPLLWLLWYGMTH